jgi:hypothetical protein
VWNKYPKIVPDAYVITYVIVIEEFNPAVPNKFPVGHQAVNAIGAKQPDKTFYQIDPFPAI